MGKYKADGGREERSFQVTELRVGKGAENEPKKISGYAAVFNSLSEDLGGFREKIDPGAFTKTLNEADVRALFNHDPNFVIGRSKSGTLKMEEDTEGLRIEIAPPDTQWARDLMTSIERGDIDQMSFGFKTIRDDWSEGTESVIRTLKEVRLFDVSPVTFPAYAQTSVSVRSLSGANISDANKKAIMEKNNLTIDEKDDKFIQGTTTGVAGDIEVKRKRLDLIEKE